MKARLKCTRIQTTQSMILERQSMNDPLQRFFIIISMQLSLRKVFGKLENFSFPFMLLPMILSFILVCVAVLYNCRILKLRLCMRVAWFRKTVFFLENIIHNSLCRQAVSCFPKLRRIARVFLNSIRQTIWVEHFFSCCEIKNK